MAKAKKIKFSEAEVEVILGEVDVGGKKKKNNILFSLSVLVWQAELKQGPGGRWLTPPTLRPLSKDLPKKWKENSLTQKKHISIHREKNKTKHNGATGGGASQTQASGMKRLCQELFLTETATCLQTGANYSVVQDEAVVHRIIIVIISRSSVIIIQDAA